MAYALPSAAALDYFPCRYGTSNLMFRGPRRSLDRPYVVFLGGNETFGKFIVAPFPDLVEAELGLASVNLGCSNAGLDLYLNEPAMLEIAAKAEAVVLQIVGAANLSNRYYTVHPRRNDRFLGATPLLKSLYRDVDFTDFAFTRHLLTALYAQSPERFAVLAQELRATWAARMKDLLAVLPERSFLLWIADQPPPSGGCNVNLDHDPLLVDGDMLGLVQPLARAYVEVITRSDARGQSLGSMAFLPTEAQAAAAVPGPEVHRDVSKILAKALENALR